MNGWFPLLKAAVDYWKGKYFQEKLGFLAEKYYFLGEKISYAQCKLDKQAIKRDHCPLQTRVFHMRFAVYQTRILSLLFDNLKSVLAI